MTWEDDWKRWTHVTYGLLQSVSLADRQDRENLRTVQDALRNAGSWSESSIGFNSEVERHGQPQENAINVNQDTVSIIFDLTKSSLASLLLVGTTSVVETLLAEILLQRGIVTSSPANLYQSLVSLRARLLELNRLDPHEWALNGSHEARILRNVIIHSDGIWRQRAIDDFMQVFPSRTPPAINSATKVNIDDLFAYRRAMRTVLNAAARS